MERDFEGRAALVTGAARGLGRAVAETLAARGAALFLVDVLGDRLAETAAELTSTGARVETLATDLTRRENCVAAVDKAVAALGRLDTLCNAAAIVRFHHVTDVSQQEWEQLLAINLSAPFYLSQAAIPHLLKTHGSIVNVASQAALIGTAYIAPYAATKAALVNMTRSMAMEYMHQPIRINAVAPGTMSTEISQGVVRPADMDLALVQRYSGMRPPADPQDVAELIVFVASDRARAIHGACLTADNGVTAG